VTGSPIRVEDGLMTGEKAPIFVVQRHDSARLHFDFRLQVGRVLASWAVPKGPSLDPREKRLAKHVEDHAIGYATFEGRIGEGYGAGTVIVWDTGTMTNLTEKDGEPVPLEQAVADGHLKVELHGHKLTGAFALTRTSAKDDPTNWVLVKVDDEGADRTRHPATTELKSVLSSKVNQDFEKA
jgi:DNA ligase D-like protein (predicted 3'-phosphoesterase)